MKPVIGHLLDITKVTCISGTILVAVKQLPIQGLLESAVLVTVFIYNSIKIYQALKNKKDKKDVN